MRVGPTSAPMSWPRPNVFARLPTRVETDYRVFAIPRQDTLGNATREILDEPGLFNWDLSFFWRLPGLRVGEEPPHFPA